jgi:hypothetical protein
MENNLCDGLYIDNRVDYLNVLTSQMAVSIENIKFMLSQNEKQAEQLRYVNRCLDSYLFIFIF